jgi:hypothetical protein
MPSPSDDRKPAAWNRCPPGEFNRLGQRLRRRRQRRLLLHAASTAAVAALVGGSGWLWFGLRSPAETNFGGIRCGEVQPLAKAYLQGQLSPAVRERIRQHIAQCPQCGPAFKAMTMPAAGSTLPRLAGYPLDSIGARECELPHRSCRAPRA